MSEEPGGTGQRVLLVEDDEDYAFIVQRMLHGEVSAVEHARTAADAYAHLRDERFECVLLDLGLPDAEGLDIVDRLREAAPGVPVVVLTGLGDDRDGEEAMRRGAQDYLLKDRVRATELRRAIRYAIERTRAASVVRQTEQRIQSLLAGVSDVIVVVGSDLQLAYVGPSVRRVFGHAPHTVQQLQRECRLVHPDDAVRVRDGLLAAVEGTVGGEPWEFRARHADGSWRVVEAVPSSVVDDPDLTGVVLTVRDVTDRRRAAEDVAVRVAQQAALAALGQRALTDVDAQALLDEACRVVADTLHTEYSAILEADLVTDTLQLRAGLGFPEEWLATGPLPNDPTSVVGAALARHEPVTTEDYETDLTLRSAARETGLPLRGALAVVVGGRERPYGVMAVGSAGPRRFSADDIHFLQSAANLVAVALERRHTEDEIRHQAMHDALTGLPNRSLLADRLDVALAGIHRSGDHCALLLMDLDRFKEVNDTLGHDVGDRVLQQIADRLRDVVRTTDTVARLGGDEFAVLCTHLGGADEADRVAAKILDALEKPCEVEAIPLQIEGSIGVAVAPEHGLDGTTLLKRADVAMYRAKRDRIGVAMYSPTGDDLGVLRPAAVAELRSAIENDGLVLHYQPKVDLKTGRFAAVEALVRWRHPARGLLAPDRFVPFAEHAGAIKPLSMWVLREALAKVRQWAEAGTPIPVSVNLSAASLHDPSLPELVSEALTGAGVAPSLLQLEITETAVLANPEVALDAADRLAQTGVSLALDDFGVGYSSLAYLKHLPISEVKIDRSFVTNMDRDRRDAAIVRAVIDLAHDLGFRVVAEGVETGVVLVLLEALGCDYAQGFHIAHPMDAAAVTTVLGKVPATRST